MSKHNKPEADVKKVIVAIHGIGDQTEFATIQKVAAQFCSYHKRAFALPLGAFHNGQEVLELPQPAGSAALLELLFAEVYWADIPRAVVNEGYKLEDAQAWAKTIAERVRQRAKDNGENYSEYDYRQLEQALREMGEALGVLGRVLRLSGRMGLFSFDLDRIILDYLADVQLVTEFKEERGRIIRRFSEKMDAIYQEASRTCSQLEIYLIAHSQGTIVGLLGLLSAICGKDPVYRRDKPPWLDCIRGLMTIGSPIDKHLALWPELFKEFLTPLHKPQYNANDLSAEYLPAPLRTWMYDEAPIEWHNYYDLGDPVGFELRLARVAFNTDKGAPQERNKWWWFKFPIAHDHQFTRSLFPGKAHNDYWTDPAVFGHFIHQVVYKDDLEIKKQAGKKFNKAPRDRRLHKLGSWFLPYITALALLFFAVYTIYKAVRNCLADDAIVTATQIFFNVGGGAALLGGLTVLARIPRLTRDLMWRLFSGVVFALGVVGYIKLIPHANRERLGQSFTFNQLDPTCALIGMVTLIAALVNVIARIYPMLGIKLLVWFGGAGMFVIIAKHPDIKFDKGEIWPVVLAGMFSLYLWWLTILFFDLVFIWRLYIRASVAQRRLFAISLERYGKIKSATRIEKFRQKAAGVRRRMRDRFTRSRILEPPR
jgi:hypothetical protein